MLPTSTLAAAESLLATCRSKAIMQATAESYTGGLIAAALTAVAGSSDVVERGFVPYCTGAKTQMLGAPMPPIEAHGAVSEEAMADGVLLRSHAAMAISVTGVAGPSGWSAEKPAGLVCFGLACTGKPAVSERQVFPGDRDAIREAAADHAFAMFRGTL